MLFSRLIKPINHCVARMIKLGCTKLGLFGCRTEMVLVLIPKTGTLLPSRSPEVTECALHATCKTLLTCLQPIVEDITGTLKRHAVESDGIQLNICDTLELFTVDMIQTCPGCKSGLFYLKTVRGASMFPYLVFAALIFFCCPVTQYQTYLSMEISDIISVWPRHEAD